MTAEIKLDESRLVIVGANNLIRGKHASQLGYWRFRFDGDSKTFIGEPSDPGAMLSKLLPYLSRYSIPFSLSPELRNLCEDRAARRADLEKARKNGASLKAGNIGITENEAFLAFVSKNLPRQLKEHQLKAALHLLSVVNGANFSVPGSGKTTVVLAVFAWLKARGEVDALFVVGPPACFGPWQTEYSSTLGTLPSAEILAGGDVEQRHSKYRARGDEVKDLYLSSFQTLQNDHDQIKRWFIECDRRFFLVVDEAHYIKQPDGVWANAVLNLAGSAERRCVLSGTPFPRTYTDAFNLFAALWPTCPPLDQNDRTRIELYEKRSKPTEAAEVLRDRIGSLFYRVRKRDLRLAAQDFQPPTLVKMNEFERRAYDSITDRVRALSKEDHFRNLDVVVQLQRGRMMRLRQAVSYAKLLCTAVAEYSESLLPGDHSLADLIRYYDDLEQPAKITALIAIVQAKRRAGEKVVIWSNFIATLKLIVQHLTEAGHGVHLIYGDTPTEASLLGDELTRERKIAEFLSTNSGVDILVANPAACAESISLHKTCAHAVYTTFVQLRAIPSISRQNPPRRWLRAQNCSLLLSAICRYHRCRHLSECATEGRTDERDHR